MNPPTDYENYSFYYPNTSGTYGLQKLVWSNTEVFNPGVAFNATVQNTTTATATAPTRSRIIKI